jgi:hypothetical protein
MDISVLREAFLNAMNRWKCKKHNVEAIEEGNLLKKVIF